MTNGPEFEQRTADQERPLVVKFLERRATTLARKGRTGSRHRAETVKILALDIADGKHRPDYVSPKHPQCCCQWGAAVSGGDEWPEFGCYRCEVHQHGLGEQPNELCKRHTREDVMALLKRAEEVQARSRIATAGIIYVEGGDDGSGS